MKNLIELNKEIEKLIKPEVFFYESYQTFSFLDKWVIELDEEYFNNWEKKIKDKIDIIADLDSPIKVKFIKIFQQHVLEKYKDNIKLNTENLEYLKAVSFGDLYSHENKPKKSCKDICSYLDNDSAPPISYNEYENIIFKLHNIFCAGNYLLENTSSEDSLCEEIHLLESEILKDLEVKRKESEIEKEKNSADLTIQLKDELNSFHKDVFGYSEDEDNNVTDEEIEDIISIISPSTQANTESQELEKIHSFVQLSLCLDKTRNVLFNIVQYLNNIVDLIKKIENYKEDELTLDDILINDPTDLKLEYKLSKMEVALFYRALHDTGVIEVNNQGQKHPYTNLKKYINSSNMYYLDNLKVDKVKNINKEFSKFLNDNKYEKQELEVLELIISKFKNRKEEILANQEEGLA